MSIFTADQRERAIAYFLFGIYKYDQAELNAEFEQFVGIDKPLLLAAPLASSEDPDYQKGLTTVVKYDGTFRCCAIGPKYHGNWPFWSGVIAGFWTQDQPIFKDEADRCAYNTRGYACFENLNEVNLRALLQIVFDKYPEYKDAGFDAMVAKFAADDFYNMHYVARAYLRLIAS